MIETATTRLEATIFAAANKQASRRLSSGELSLVLRSMVAKRVAGGEASRILVTLMRLAIKAMPYEPGTDALLAEQGRMLRALAAGSMSQVVETVATCTRVGVPVPLIVSCHAYLTKAREAQAGLARRYGGIEPIIVRGDAALAEEHGDGSILTLPCDDSYEALPKNTGNPFDKPADDNSFFGAQDNSSLDNNYDLGNSDAASNDLGAGNDFVGGDNDDNSGTA